MNGTESEMNHSRKKLTGKALIVFFGFMLLLTFFSNTINNFSLPKVTYETPSRGSIVKEISAPGAVQARKVLDEYTQTGMQVLSLNVKTGDPVKMGQVLMTLDTSSVESQLLDEKARYEQKKISLDKLKAAYSSNILSQDKSVESAKNSLDTAQAVYDSTKALYEEGAESGSNLNSAENSLNIARMDYELAKSNRDKASSDNQNDIKSLEYDIQIEERKIQQLEDQMKLSSVTAPADGIITELNFQEGAMAGSSAPLYKLSVNSGGFLFKASVDYDLSSYLAVGDAAVVSLDSMNGRTIQGKVMEIADNPQQKGVKKDVFVEIATEGISGGESGDMDIKKDTGSYNTLVSNSAVGQDNSGYFVYTVIQSSGPLGNEYHAKKAYVTTGESDDLKTAVINGLSPMDRVIDYSDKPISDGTRIMLTQ